MPTDPAIKQKIDALRELQAERDKRKRDADTRAYADTLAAHGTIPRVILDGDDKDAQRARMMVEWDNPPYWIEREIINPPPAVELPGAMLSGNPRMRDVTPPKSYVDDNVRRVEAIPASPPPATSSDPGPNAVLCMTMEKGTPVFYAFDPGTRMLTLCEHNGGVTRTGDKVFQVVLPAGADADDAAIALWLRSRGKPSADPFDGPINYPAPLRLPRGA